MERIVKLFDWDRISSIGTALRRKKNKSSQEGVFKLIIMEFSHRNSVSVSFMGKLNIL